jgi:hypothetical protein
MRDSLGYRVQHRSGAGSRPLLNALSAEPLERKIGIASLLSAARLVTALLKQPNLQFPGELRRDATCSATN